VPNGAPNIEAITGVLPTRRDGLRSSDCRENPLGRQRGLVDFAPRDDRGTARGKFSRTVGRLLGEAGKADADQSAIGLGMPLPLADRVEPQQFGT
jgi:hypothetical protein